MGQIIGRAAKPDACNIRSLSSYGVPAAGQHILVSTDNSAMQNGQGNFDAYVVGDGTTAATELPLIMFKAEELDIQLNGIPSFNQTIHIPTTAGSSVSNNVRYDMPLESGKEYAVTITGTSVKFPTIYLKDASGNAVSFYVDGGTTASSNASFDMATGTKTRTIKPLSDVAKVAFYVSSSNVVGSDGFDANFSFESSESGVLNEINERLEALEENETEVVDNLSSTSASDALSANQGRVLGTEVDALKKSVPESLWEEVNVQNLTSIPMVINRTASEGVYKWTSNRSSSQQISIYRHSRLKCKEGDKFLVFANENNDFYYAWLTSFDATYDTAAPLVTGTTPMSIPAGGYSYIEAPAGAVFLYFRRSVTAIGNTELLPSKMLRFNATPIEVAVPITRMFVTIDSTGNFVDGTNGDYVTRCVKVKQGEKIKYHTDYTADVNTGRPIVLAFSQKLPEVGGTCTIVDKSENYAAHIIYNDFYTAPFDGYFCVSHGYGTRYYTDYAFYKTIVGDDATKPLKDEKIVVFGDSILQLTYSYTNRGFVEYLAEFTGAKVIRGAIGGTRLIPRANNDSFFAFDISNLIHAWVNNSWTEVDAALLDYPEYSDIISGLKAVRPTEVTMIVIDGGGNDLSNPNLTFGDASAADIFNENPLNTTLYGAVNYIMRDLFTANPYLKIFWVGGMVNFTGSSESDRTSARWIDNRTYTIDGATYTALEYRAKITEQVQKWKVPYISMADLCINPVNFSKFFIANDNTHPYKGFDRMAKIVASQIVARMM